MLFNAMVLSSLPGCHVSASSALLHFCFLSRSLRRGLKLVLEDQNPWGFSEQSCLPACFDRLMVLEEHNQILGCLVSCYRFVDTDFAKRHCQTTEESFAQHGEHTPSQNYFGGAVFFSHQSSFLPVLIQLYSDPPAAVSDASSHAPQSQSCASSSFSTLQCGCLLASSTDLEHLLLRHSLARDYGYH